MHAPGIDCYTEFYPVKQEEDITELEITRSQTKIHGVNYATQTDATSADNLIL